MNRRQQNTRGGVLGRAREAAARLWACLPEQASPEALKGLMVQGVAHGWQRSEAQRTKLGQRLRWGSAKLAEQPIPRVARQGLEHFDALVDCLAPPAAPSADDEAAAEHHAVASETLVSPLDDGALNNGPTDDNCLAAGTTPGKPAAPPRAPREARRGGSRRGGRRGGAPKS